nr:hypothetical protein [Nitrospinaceae bacterium]NIT83195.1 hypothetical protein [Nitrospinaceae bacterium]NIU45406.1 hypothetical protein [Nitrospinaceae bacterium]NIW06983.1 hypothetical protein [Nitrospinaceae bacterium]NIX35560.1 hypothetical protein [Nitrospinaceae bacterium]
MNFAVPINQILLFVLIGSLCLLLGKHKVGLLISYGFVFYWGFILNRGYFMKELEQTQIGVYAYGVMGF